MAVGRSFAQPEVASLGAAPSPGEKSPYTPWKNMLEEPNHMRVD